MTFTIAIYEARDGKDVLFDRITVNEKTPRLCERVEAYLLYVKDMLWDDSFSKAAMPDSFYYLKVTAYGIVIPVALADDFIDSLTLEKISYISLMPITYFTQRIKK